MQSLRGLCIKTQPTPPVPPRSGRNQGRQHGRKAGEPVNRLPLRGSVAALPHGESVARCARLRLRRSVNRLPLRGSVAALPPGESVAASRLGGSVKRKRERASRYAPILSLFQYRFTDSPIHRLTARRRRNRFTEPKATARRRRNRLTDSPMPQLPRILIENDDAIRRLCMDLNVRELCVFGSVITDRFDPARSDLDFLVEFHDPDT